MSSSVTGQSNPRATYRNPWHKANGSNGQEFFTTDAKPAQIGRYQRFHVIKSNADGGNVYDFVLNGVCIAQFAGPKNEEQVGACWATQDTLRKLGFVS